MKNSSCALARTMTPAQAMLTAQKHKKKAGSVGIFTCATIRKESLMLRSLDQGELLALPWINSNRKQIEMQWETSQASSKCTLPIIIYNASLAVQQVNVDLVQEMLMADNS